MVEVCRRFGMMTADTGVVPGTAAWRRGRLTLRGVGRMIHVDMVMTILRGLGPIVDGCCGCLGSRIRLRIPGLRGCRTAFIVVTVEASISDAACSSADSRPRFVVIVSSIDRSCGFFLIIDTERLGAFPGLLMIYRLFLLDTNRWIIFRVRVLRSWVGLYAQVYVVIIERWHFRHPGGNRIVSDSLQGRARHSGNSSYLGLVLCFQFGRFACTQKLVETSEGPSDLKLVLDETLFGSRLRFAMILRRTSIE